MGVDVFTPNAQTRTDYMGADNPATEITPDGFWSGTGTAIGKGVMGGEAAIARVGYDAYNKITGNQPDPNAGYLENFNDQLQYIQDWAKTDPRTTGTGAAVAGSLARAGTILGLGSVAGGPMAGAATLGVTEGYDKYRELRSEGVDPTTATETGAVTGVLNAAGAFLPMALGEGLATKAAFGATINTGFGMASRALTSKVLEAGGYPEMAAQYKATDGQSILSDAILGAAFGGIGHLESKIGGASKEIPPLERPTQDLVGKALDIRREEQTSRGGAGIPTDLQTANLDHDLQDRSLFEVLQGKTPDISSEEARVITEGSLFDPEKIRLHDDLVSAGEAVHGDLADPAEPLKFEEEPAPYITEETPTATESANERSAAIDPLAAENLRQLATRHPDMDVEMPDGTTIKASQLQDKMREALSAAESDSKLHDIAIACFLRTL